MLITDCGAVRILVIAKLQITGVMMMLIVQLVHVQSIVLYIELVGVMGFVQAKLQTMRVDQIMRVITVHVIW